MQEIEENAERSYQQEEGGRGGSGLAALLVCSFSDLKPALMTNAISISTAPARGDRGSGYNSALPSALELRILCWKTRYKYMHGFSTRFEKQE